MTDFIEIARQAGGRRLIGESAALVLMLAGLAGWWFVAWAMWGAA